MKHILVTGNNGYIGPVMTCMLKERGYTVCGLDSNLFVNNELFPISHCLPDRQIIKDIRFVSQEDIHGIDSVIHLAGLSNDPMGEINPALTEEINYKASIHLATLCKQHNVKRFIFASSCSIYGISNPDEAIDETGQINPITSYAKAKVATEQGLTGLASDEFHPVYMRNATVYGLSPRLRLDLVVNNLLAWAYLVGRINIMSDGTPWRPIVHINDFCAAFLAALEAPLETIHCQAFNVGINEENYQVKDIAAIVNEYIPNASVNVLNETGPDERSYRVNFSKIRNVLSAFTPTWNLRKGIEQLHDAYKRYKITMEDFQSDKFFRIRTLKAHIAAKRVDENLYLKGAIQ